MNNLAKEDTIRALSPAQMGIWVAQCLDPESPVYNIAEYMEILGPIDPIRFETALRQVVAQTDALHIRVVETDQGPRQCLDLDPDWAMPFIDVSTEPDPRAAAEAWMHKEMGRAVDLAHGPLFGFALFRAAPDRFLWYARGHHLINDGFGAALFIRRVAELYSALAESNTPAETARLSFFDLLGDEKRYRCSSQYDRDRDYWRKQLADRPAPVTLCGKPPARSRGFIRSTDHLALRDADALRVLCTSYQVSFPQIVTAAAAIYLHRLTGEQILTLGIPLTARVGARMRRIVGQCSNILPLRLAIAPHDSLGDVLRQVSRGMRQMLRHQRYRSEDLRRDLALRRDQPEMYGLMVNVMTFGYDLRFDGNPAEVHDLSNGPVDDLAIAVYDRQSGSDVRIDFDANPAHYTGEMLASHQRRFLGLLAQFTKATPDLSLHRFDMLGDRERHTLLEIFNNTASDYPRDRCVHRPFEEQVEKTPAAVAVSFENQTLTYGELNAQANQLARYLRRLHVGPEVAVGICVERGLEIMTGLFAILKAGGTYVPLDPAFPQERLAFMLADSRSAVLLTQKKLLGLLPHEGVQVVCLDADESVISKEGLGNLEQIAAPEDLAYVIYTSGSTGKPKGVEISHRALTNFLYSMRSEPGCTERDVLLAVTTLSFDIAGLELYLPLIVGGRVDLVSRQVAADGPLLKRHIERNPPSLLQATPATWRMLIASGWRGTPGMTALCGGEGLPLELANQLLDRTAALWNMYGPTETTIWSSIHRVSPADPEITVGRPIANTEMYILDQNLQPVPVGVPGELFIGGDGLARGYRNRPELTTERFLPDSFAKESGARLYRTGDLARYREDGSIIHLGRLDHQVKLRGFRIELGEIEAALAEHESVGQVVVMFRDDRPGDPYLAAYVIATPGKKSQGTELRQYLRTKLPDYMVPQHILDIEAFPLTPNGKIDRKRLPAPEWGVSADHVAFAPPRNPTEKLLAQIFADVLEVPQVGIHDNFFELGGHSLLAVQLISSISSTFKVNLPLQVLFDAPTVVGLSIELDDATRLPQTGKAKGSVSTPTRSDEPRTRTERRLLAIWERLLPGRKIGVRDSFFALQGSEDLLYPMLEEVKRDFRVFAEGLPVITFIDEPTVEALARIINAGAEPPSSLVVCLHPHGFKAPLFLIHAGGGYVFFYRALVSRMRGDRPVYAIRAETKEDGLGQPFDRSESIEKLATRYIAELKTVQPNGPYSLGGACVGGVIAFEMARQLRARGEEVADPVLLIDSFVANNPRAREYQEKIMNAQAPRPRRERIARILSHASGFRIDKKIWYLAGKSYRPIYRRFLNARAKLAEAASELWCNFLCVPGMGMILWGASPLYIFREGVIVTPSKSTSRRQGLRGDPMSERSRSANLRADGQKPYIRPNPWAREHNIPKPVRRTWGLVNTAVVQGKIMFLPGEICPALRPPTVGALHAVMHGVIGQKSADGIVVESFLMKRRPEA